jgi:hypothetical protein
MPTMSDYFSKAQPAWKVHPMVKYWSALQASPEVKELRMEIYRPREGLAFRPADIYVHVERKDGKPEAPQKAAWESVLNEGLVQLHVKAVSPDSESQRYSLMFQSAFEPIDVRFGEAFFNAVLVDLIRSGPFARAPHVARILKRIHEYEPRRENAWSECKEMIDNAIRALGETLVDQLRYPQPEAEAILVEALAQYLDERFNVTNRKLLGW